MDEQLIERIRRGMHYEFERTGPPDGFPAFHDIPTGRHTSDHFHDLEKEYLWPNTWVIAGRGDGTLRNGVYVDAGDVTHDKLLATLLTATGHRTNRGAPIEQFGDPSLAGGLIDAMLA